MLGLGYQELLLILVIALVLFGGSKLPELAKSLGKSMREFKNAVAGEANEGGSTKPASAVTSTASRTCVSCKTPLEPAWSHCPRCGTAIREGSTPA